MSGTIDFRKKANLEKVNFRLVPTIAPTLAIEGQDYGLDVIKMDDTFIVTGYSGKYLFASKRKGEITAFIDGYGAAIFSDFES